MKPRIKYLKQKIKIFESKKRKTKKLINSPLYIIYTKIIKNTGEKIGRKKWKFRRYNNKTCSFFCPTGEDIHKYLFNK